MSKEKGILGLVRRYEQNIAENRSVYFDADQFSDIAMYYDSEEEIETAREVLEVGLQIHPESEILLLKKAKFLAYDSKYEKALDMVSPFSGYDYELFTLRIECYLQLGESENAIQLISDVLNNEEGQDLYMVISDIGFLFSEAGYFNEAANYFEESLKINSENTDVLLDLAYVYEMLGDVAKSIDTNNAILDIDSYNYEVWVNQGRLYSLIDEYGKAIDAFDFALTINDEDPTIQKLKGHCLILSGRILEAIEIFRDLLKQYPEDSSLYLLLSESYTSLSLYNEAMDILEQYRNIEGDAIEYLKRKVYVLMHMKKYQEALTLICEGLESHGVDPDLYSLSGDIKFEMEAFEDAEVDYRSAYSLDVDSYDLLDKLAVTAIRLEKYELAIKYTEELLLLSPENIELKKRLALLFFEINDKVKFNEIINEFSEEELMELFKLFYDPVYPESFDKDSLINALNEAHECRLLFKNLSH